MRSFEFIIEANLAPNELRKHAGKYLSVLLRKIESNEPIEIVPDQQARYGESVVLDKKSARDLLQAFFGTNKMPPQEEMNLSDNGDIIAVGVPQDIVLTTTSGDQLKLSSLQKTAEYKSGKEFNTGDIAEGVLGAAIAARFLKREKDITEEDVVEVLKAMGGGELIGKRNLKGTMSGNSGNDKVYFILGLNSTSYNALYGAAQSGEMHNEIRGALRSAVGFANENSSVHSALEQIIKDPNSNKITVKSDGTEDQKGTKADLFLDIDGETVNLLSLKAGDVKQFGQSSGYNFTAVDNFFSQTFGVNVPDSLRDGLVDGDAKKSFAAIHKIYNAVGDRLSRELAGDVDEREARFVERLYKGVKQHATRGDDMTSMVILKQTPNAPGYVQLTFGKQLEEAMANIDLKVEVRAPGTGTAAIDVYGVGSGGVSQKLLTLRSNYKSEGKGYVRNIVEMGPLLKTIATIETNIQKKKNA